MSWKRHMWRKGGKAKKSQVNIKEQHKKDTMETKEVKWKMITNSKSKICMMRLCKIPALNGGEFCLRHRPKAQKICVNVKCKNQAPKDSVWCGIHKPSANSAIASKVGCHKGNVLVFTTPDGIEVYGGGSSRGGGWWVMSPLPDLAIGPKEIVNKAINTHKFPKGWLIDSISEPIVPIVALDFPDYGVPRNLGKVFWLSLVEDIYTHGVKRISCQCMGGHGRTGVQLCILAHYLLPDSQHKWKDAGELIDWVRDKMCIHEVEARKQQDYIAEVCDIPVGKYKVESSRYSTVYSGGSNWNYEGTQWATVLDDLDDEDDEDFGHSDSEGDAVGGIHSAPQSNIDLDLDEMDSPKQTKLYDLVDRVPDDLPVEIDDEVFECLDCDVREIWGEGLAPLDQIGALVCLECGGDMIDITDLAETQVELRTWIAEQHEEQDELSDFRDCYGKGE